MVMRYRHTLTHGAHTSASTYVTFEMENPGIVVSMWCGRRCVRMLARFLHSKHILVEKLNKYICKSAVSGVWRRCAHTLGECRNCPEFTTPHELARSSDDDDLPQASKNEQYERYEQQRPEERVKTFNCQKFIFKIQQLAPHIYNQ